MPRIDLNCDLGEGAGRDAEIMPFITSANIACGGHAGDDATMRAIVRLARRQGVSIGAHPGFADREHFGRRELVLPPAEITTLVRRQVGNLQVIACEEDATVTFVKPHGALYNLAARSPAVAKAIANAVKDCGPDLILYGLAGSESLRAGRECGLSVAGEVFADRTYQADGSLTPRNRADALITEEAAAIAQVLRLIREGRVRTAAGEDVALKADTLCLHGDGAHAVAFARRLREVLTIEGVEIRALA